MTEEVQKEAAQPQQNKQIPPITEQQLNGIKNSLIAHMNQAYMTFINTLVQLPCDVNGLKQALVFFDTGLFWFEKAIHKMPVQDIKIEEPVQETKEPEAPVEPEAPCESTAPDAA